jgi:hypothetical protein
MKFFLVSACIEFFPAASVFILNLFSKFCVFSDYAYPWQISFQEPASPVMEGIIVLHHDLLFILTIIGFAV